MLTYRREETDSPLVVGCLELDIKKSGKRPFSNQHKTSVFLLELYNTSMKGFEEMEAVSPFYEKELECRLCGESFTTTRLRTRFVKVDHYETDFCPIYQSNEINPLLYHINVCPHCGFSYSDDFSRYFPPASKEDLIEKVCSHWVSRDFGKTRSIQAAIGTLKLAAYCAGIKKEKKLTLAGLYLRIAWLHRLSKQNKEEQRFMKIAASLYTDAYLSEDIQSAQMSEMKVLYLIAELSNRTGQYNTAIQYFSKIIERQNTTTERTIVEMARDQWSDLRESLKKEAQSF
jgi:uncharacterized protein